MNEATRSEVKKSWFGGLLGGGLAYLLGALTNSDWLMFFLLLTLGYLGYNIRQTISVFMSVCKTITRAHFQAAKEVSPFPKTSIAVFYLLAIFLFGAFNGNANMFSLNYLTSWPIYVYSNFYWLVEGHNPFGLQFADQTFGMRFVSVFFAAGLGSLFLSLMISFVASGFALGIRELYTAGHLHPKRLIVGLLNTLVWSMGKIVWPLAFAVRFLRRHANEVMKLIGLMLYLCTVGIIVSLLKILAYTLIGIHSARRLACGLATVSGGMVYMIFVPFNLPGVPVALAAAGCALVCMGATTLTAVLLDGERVKTSLWTYVAKPIIPTSLRLKTARS